MDSVTQIILGATIAEAGFRKKLGNKAIAFGAFCGLCPDLDVLIALLGDRWLTLVYHRGFSHSLIFLAFLTPFLAWGGWHFSGKNTPFRSWFFLAFWALMTHPLLDLCTSYGTQIFIPLNYTKYTIDAISIIDLVYTLPLLFSLILLKWGGRWQSWSQKTAVAALVFTTGYLALGYFQSQKILAISKQQLLEQKIVFEEVRTIPTIGNIGLWRVLARDSNKNLWVGAVSSFFPQQIKFQKFLCPNNPLVKKVLQHEKGKIFANFCGHMYAIKLEKNKEGSTVFLYDQRYSMISDPLIAPFAVRFDFSETTLKNIEFLPRSFDFDKTKELQMRWRLFWGEQQK